jgi:adenosylcobinamide amidohydrolase
VGLGAPIQAAAPGAGALPQHAGTVNVIAWVPQRLSPGALVNAVATITEAKTQAIRELGLAATGTATDAVCVLCPPDGPVAAYAGPRSAWGAPLARATHRAVLDGGVADLRPWSDQ